MKNNLMIISVSIVLSLSLLFSNYVNVAYASSIEYNNSSFFETGKSYGIARTDNYIYVVGMKGTVPYLWVFNPDGTDHYKTRINDRDGISGGCDKINTRTDVLPAKDLLGNEAIVFVCDVDGEDAIVKFNSTGYLQGLSFGGSCSNVSHKIKLVGSDLLSFACKADNLVGLMNTTSFSIRHIVTLVDTCQQPLVSFEDTNQDAMVVLCDVEDTVNLYHVQSELALTTLVSSYDVDGGVYVYDDMDCSIDLGRCAIASRGQSVGTMILQWNAESDYSNAEFTSLGRVGTHISKSSIWVTDSSSIGSIALVGSAVTPHTVEVLGLHRSETFNPIQIGQYSLSGTEMDFGGASVYFDGENNLFYVATNSPSYAIIDITGLTQDENDPDLNGGTDNPPTGGGSGGSSNNTNTCPTLTGCTITEHLNNWWCFTHLTDDCENIQTNGLGFILVILMLGFMILFFMFISKRQLEKIHPIVWIVGVFAVLALATGLGLIAPYFLLLGIFVIVLLGAWKIIAQRNSVKAEM